MKVDTLFFYFYISFTKYLLPWIPKLFALDFDPTISCFFWHFWSSFPWCYFLSCISCAFLCEVSPNKTGFPVVLTFHRFSCLFYINNPYGKYCCRYWGMVNEWEYFLWMHMNLNSWHTYEKTVSAEHKHWGDNVRPGDQVSCKP